MRRRRLRSRSLIRRSRMASETLFCFAGTGIDWLVCVELRLNHEEDIWDWWFGLASWWYLSDLMHE